MLIQVSQQRLEELREMSAHQLLNTLTQEQIERCGLGDFTANGTCVTVLPKPAISQDGDAVRAALAATHDYVELDQAPSAEREGSALWWNGHELEAVRRRLFTYSREDWIALYPSVTWYGSLLEPIVWHCGDAPSARRVSGVFRNINAKMRSWRFVDRMKPRRCVDGHGATCRTTHDINRNFYVPWPEVERRIDEGTLQELVMLANCYAE